MKWTSSRAILLAAVTLLLCYANILRGMVDQWLRDEDMGHGVVVPFAILFILWRERERWRGLPVAPTRWGLAVIGFAAVAQFLSVMGGGLFLGSLAFIFSIIGAILCLGGWIWLRAWKFPLLLTLFMLPKLAVVYNQTTLPLQLLASRLAAQLLTLSGVAVIRAGNILDVGGHQVAVAEACSGIRFLLPLAFLSVLFAYLADSKAWMRLALLASIVPVAVCANGVRVAFSAYSPRLAEGTPHALLGALIFLVSLALLIPIHRAWNALAGASRA
jgi:exosortase